METENPDWHDWHEGYRPDSGSHLVRRLAVVQQMVRAAIDARPLGPIRVASLCAGQGDDVLGALAEHPRRADVRAVLIEADERNVEVCRERAAAAGLDRVQVMCADAGTTTPLADIVPVDVLLLCGMFGNITLEHVEQTIDACPSLLSSGAAIIWTRRSIPVDLTPRIRSRFASIGCRNVEFVNPLDDKFTVGHERFDGTPSDFVADRHLFDFVGFRTLIERGE